MPPSKYFPNTQFQTTILADDKTVASTDAFYFYLYGMYFSFLANYSIKLCCQNSFKLYIYIYIKTILQSFP